MKKPLTAEQYERKLEYDRHYRYTPERRAWVRDYRRRQRSSLIPQGAPSKLNWGERAKEQLLNDYGHDLNARRWILENSHWFTDDMALRTDTVLYQATELDLNDPDKILAKGCSYYRRKEG